MELRRHVHTAATESSRVPGLSAAKGRERNPHPVPIPVSLTAGALAPPVALDGLLDSGAREPASEARPPEPASLAVLKELLEAWGEADGLIERLDILTRRLLACGLRGAAVFGTPTAGGKIVLLSSHGLSIEELTTGQRWILTAARSRSQRQGRRPAPTGFHSLGTDGLLFPLVGGEGILGALVAHPGRSGPAIEGSVDLLAVFSGLVTLLLEQSRSRAEAETSRHARLEQLETLAESGQAIAESMEISEVCDSILSLLMKLLSARASWIMLYRPQSSTLEIASYRGLGKEKLSGISLRAEEGVAGKVFQSRKPWLVADVQKEDAFLYREVAVRAGLRTMLAVPLLVRSEAIGVMGVFLPDVPLDVRERTAMLETVEVFAGQAAAAIQNAHLYQRLEQAYVRERRIAETFQHALLSDVPERVDGVEIGHIYRSALDEAVVGGDFYDVFPLQDSRIVLVIGDVSGKGLTAAVQTARVKFGMRGFAFDDPSPERVLERIQQSLISQGSFEGFVSVFFGVLDLPSRVLAFANAGHEPPLLYRQDGSLEWLTRTGTVIGINLPTPAEFERRSVDLAPGDQLLLYTDGFTEARRGGKFLGRSGLLSLWEKVASQPPKEAVMSLFESVRTFVRGNLRDDAAAVVVRIP